MTLAVLLAAAVSAAAAPLPVRAPLLAGTTVELKAVDGWTLRAVYQQAEPGKLTLVLLHGTGQRKEDWRLFARALKKAGYGYVALDLRGHGESRVSPSGETLIWKKLRASAKGANDYADMTRDVEAAVGWLGGQGVAEETVAPVGAEVGGSVAIKYAAVHPKTPLVVVLSPGLAWQEIPLVNAVRAFKGRATPILMIHSEADKRSAKETPLLYAFAKNSVGEKNVTLMVAAQERGTRLFKGNKGLDEQVIAWFSNPVAPEKPAVSTAAALGASTAPATVPVSSAAAASPDDEPPPLPDDETAPAPAPAEDGGIQ